VIQITIPENGLWWACDSDLQRSMRLIHPVKVDSVSNPVALHLLIDYGINRLSPDRTLTSTTHLVRQH